MNEQKPRVLRNVKLLSYGPDLHGLGEILSVTGTGEASGTEPPCGGDEQYTGAGGDQQARE